MSDPTEFLSLAIVLSLVLGVWFAIRECANASLHGNRNWWRRAVYLARQRAEYREFSKGLDEVQELNRMTD